MDEKIIGSGWSFPPEFTIKDGKGSVMMVSGEDEIRQSLSVIVSTARKERFLHPDFGTALRDYQFHTITPAFILHLTDLVRDSITKYEPRVKVNDVKVSSNVEEPGRLDISVHYSIMGSVTSDTFVFPFYTDTAI